MITWKTPLTYYFAAKLSTGVNDAPEDLEGKLTLIIANLAPRKMRFGISKGMVPAADHGGKDIWILTPDQSAVAGMRVK